jgi:hypothetical protein
MPQTQSNQAQLFEESLKSISAKFKEMRETHVSSTSTVYEKSGDVVIVSIPNETNVKNK